MTFSGMVHCRLAVGAGSAHSVDHAIELVGRHYFNAIVRYSQGCQDPDADQGAGRVCGSPVSSSATENMWRGTAVFEGVFWVLMRSRGPHVVPPDD